MGKNPAFLFYPSDWQRDLEEHPLEIEGAWIRICCKLWWSETRGQMTKSLQQWARILREKEKNCEKILKYLSKNGVATINFLDNQNVEIISRRMIKDERIRQIRREVGKKGGNPLLKQNAKGVGYPKLNQSHNQKCPSSVSVSVSVSKINTIMWDAEKKDFSGITTEDINAWQEAYPIVDIKAEIYKAREWIKANPKNRKSNYRRFLSNWFSRRQDRGDVNGESRGYIRSGYRGKEVKEFPDEVNESFARVQRKEREFLAKQAAKAAANNTDNEHH